MRRILLVAAPLLAAGVLGAMTGSVATNFVRVPRVSELATYRPDIITEIQGSDGSTIARYAIERRFLLTRSEIPPVVKNAIVATEDKNFYAHGGLDVRRTARALLTNVAEQRIAQGGSTMTQQLARAIFLSPKKTLSRKINEAFVAFEIERRYSKDQILTMYANEIYLGHGNYGFEAASRYYFGKSVKEVTLAEAALLAGIVQRPEDQSPFRNPALASKRRTTALRRMRDEGYIGEGEMRAALAEPLPSSPSLQETIVGPYFCEEIRQYLEKTYGEKDLYRRGLHVESTLDPELQAFSDEALGWGLRQLARRRGFKDPRNLLKEGYQDLDAYVDPSWEGSSLTDGEAVRGVVTKAGKNEAEVRIAGNTLTLPASGYAWTNAKAASRILERGDLVTVTLQKSKDGKRIVFLEQEPREQGAVLILESATGAIRAMTGGYDWTQSKFNRATQALRQAGSTFKPFVYLAALEAGYTPSDTIFDGPLAITFDPRRPPYSPTNYDGRYRGIVTLRRALEYSYNVSAVRLSELVGRDHVIASAHRLGIRQKLDPWPSLALGAFEVTLLEMASAYSVFANQGLAFTPYYFERITDANGDLLEQVHPDPREVASPQASFQLLQMMKGVTQRGTAARAASLKLNIAGKTGTTNDFTDAWFIGMTPRYTIGVWVGNDPKTTLGARMDGSRAALPIWIRLLEKMKERGRVDPKADFEPPPNVVFTAVDYETGLKATPGSPKPILEAFVSGSQPTEEWSEQWEDITRLPWSLQKSFYTPKAGETAEAGDSAAPPAPGPAPPALPPPAPTPAPVP